MTDSLVLLATALVCLLVGSTLTILLTKGRVRAAAEQARGEAATDLAVAKEQLRLQAEERTQLQTQAGALQTDVERWRAALDESSADGAEPRRLRLHAHVRGDRGHLGAGHWR